MSDMIAFVLTDEWTNSYMTPSTLHLFLSTPLFRSFQQLKKCEAVVGVMLSSKSFVVFGAKGLN
jgi:hypothetical protein